jgi:hypothetical protein
MYPYGIAWILIVGWRLFAIRRWFALPTFHGADYFFDTRVPAGFYEGEGRPLLRRFRRLVMLPLLIELPVTAAAGFWSGWDFRLLLGIALFSTIAGAFRIGSITKFAKDASERLGPTGQVDSPPIAVTLSLAPRQLKEYRVARVEWLIRGMVAAGLGLDAYTGIRGGAQADWPALIAMPLVFLYLLLGVHLIQKHLVTARLLRLPAGDPETYLAFREDFRRHWLRMADLIRILLALPILVGGIQAAIPDNWISEKTGMYLFQAVVWASVVILLYGVSRLTSRFVARAKALGPRAQRPKAVPEATQARGFAGFFCWETELPGMIVRGDKRHLLNLGSAQMRIYAAYLAGFAILAGLSFL